MKELEEVWIKATLVVGETVEVSSPNRVEVFDADEVEICRSHAEAAELRKELKEENYQRERQKEEIAVWKELHANQATNVSYFQTERNKAEAENAELRQENEKFRKREMHRNLENSREYQALRGDIPRVYGERALRILNEGLERGAAEASKEIEFLRQQLSITTQERDQWSGNYCDLRLETDKLEAEVAEAKLLRERVESLEKALWECDSFLSGQIAFMYQRHLELVDGEGLAEEKVRDLVRAALSQANAPAKQENQEEEAKP